MTWLLGFRAAYLASAVDRVAERVEQQRHVVVVLRGRDREDDRDLGEERLPGRPRVVRGVVEQQPDDRARLHGRQVLDPAVGVRGGGAEHLPATLGVQCELDRYALGRAA